MIITDHDRRTARKARDALSDDTPRVEDYSDTQLALMSLTTLARTFKLCRMTLHYRLEAIGLTRREALTADTAALKRRHGLMATKAREKGLSPSLVSTRLGRGWTLEEALNTPVVTRGRKRTEGRRNETQA